MFEPLNYQDSKISQSIINIEKIVLGALLNNVVRKSIAEEDVVFLNLTRVIAPIWFSLPIHRVIFEAITDLKRKGEVVDLQSVSNVYAVQNVLAEVMDEQQQYQVNLRDELYRVLEQACQCWVDFESSVKDENIVQAFQAKVSLLQSHYANKSFFDLQVAYNKIRHQDTSVEQKVKDLSAHLADISTNINFSHQAPQSLQEIGQSVLNDSLKMIEDAIKRNGHLEFTGASSGFAQLDRLINGIERGKYIIIAARPSMGKTTFALNIAANLSNLHYQRDKIPLKGLFINLEMTKKEMVTKYISCQTGIEMYKLKTGQLSESEIKAYSDFVEKIGEVPLTIRDSTEDVPSADWNDIKQLIRDEYKKGNCDYVVLDYIQLMRNSLIKLGEQQNTISINSTEIKQLANELQIPMIVLAQLNRDSETRKSKKPILADLKGSGSLEQDADIVLFIHQDNEDPLVLKEKVPPATTLEEVKLDEKIKAKTNVQKINTRELIIAKSRNAERDLTITLKFDGAKSLFTDIGEIE